jgi:methyl-accepting chemotaxis protein
MSGDHTSMTDPTPDRSTDPVRARASSALRLRLWLACLGGSIIAAAGIGWVIGAEIGPNTNLDAVVNWLAAFGGLAVLTSLGLAFWLDRGIVVHARGLARSVAERETASISGLPATSGWGELSLLTRQIEQLLARHRQAESAAEDLGALRDQLALVRESLDRWTVEERWVELKTEAGPASPAVEALNRGLRRWNEVREQNLEAARQVAAEMERALQSARDSAEQSERGFVEATALLTTVRELQRLGQELAQTVVSTSGTAPSEFQASVVASARQAIEALVEGSTQTVDQLSRGLARVEEIAGQVPVLANRATLVALNSTLEPGAGREERVEETRRLVMDIRAAVDRTSHLTHELANDVAAATEEMRSVRERVAEKLDAIQMPAPSPRALEDVSRLLDRIREMIQDATRKGERLSATGERASRAAESLTRTLETDTREMSGLIARLAPPSPSAARTEAADPGRASGLRLLGPDEAPRERSLERRTPGTGEEPR